MGWKLSDETTDISDIDDSDDAGTRVLHQKGEKFPAQES